MEKEKLGTRLGFILISAGCAIGLGNVWRFPYIAGKNGGAAFILIYLIFLLIFGIPVMAMEFSVGRASGKSIATGFTALEKEGSKWHFMKYVGLVGNYMLMMFYTTVAGWMIRYLVKYIKGDFAGLDADAISGVFGDMISGPAMSVIMVIIVIALGFGICALGLQNGVEKITKVMMVLLFVAMFVLVGRVLTMGNVSEGLKYYLVPDFGRMAEQGAMTVIFEAMGQAFFTLSIGIGSMQIFGSCIDKKKSLFGEAAIITGLDTLVAVMAGIIIIPSCFAFGIEPGAGPSLIFITLPNIFGSMAGGRIWGIFFFVFMTFAAMSTVIAVFENIVSMTMEIFGTSRKKACAVNIVLLAVLALPCALSFGVLAGFQPLGEGTGVLDLEDFIVSNNLLPLGALVYVLFCTWKFGWGWDNFEAEINEGTGMKMPKWMRPYLQYVLPLLIIFVFVMGYISLFG